MRRLSHLLGGGDILAASKKELERSATMLTRLCNAACARCSNRSTEAYRQLLCQ
jgi:hypothetical protein